jgi:hypothetical protein
VRDQPLHPGQFAWSEIQLQSVLVTVNDALFLPSTVKFSSFSGEQLLVGGPVSDVKGCILTLEHMMCCITYSKTFLL